MQNSISYKAGFMILTSLDLFNSDPYDPGYADIAYHRATIRSLCWTRPPNYHDDCLSSLLSKLVAIATTAHKSSSEPTSLSHHVSPLLGVQGCDVRWPLFGLDIHMALAWPFTWSYHPWPIYHPPRRMYLLGRVNISPRSAVTIVYQLMIYVVHTTMMTYLMLCLQEW